MITIDFKEVKEKVSPIVHYCTHVPGFTWSVLIVNLIFIIL
jgi:hypothetical protein